jgi:hypothetical protein
MLETLQGTDVDTHGDAPSDESATDAKSVAIEPAETLGDVGNEEGEFDLGDDEPQEVEEHDDLEVDGKKFQLPKKIVEKLKTERLLHSDYTHKTQALAEERRAFEAQKESHKQEAQTYIAEVANIAAIERELAKFKELDWKTLIDQAPTEALKYQQIERELEKELYQAVQTLEHKKTADGLSKQQAIAKQAQEAETYFQREIQGWSRERSDQLMKFGVAHGIPADAISQAVLKNPAFAKLIHKAELYDQLTKKQAPAVTAPQQAKPAAKVGNNASVKKDPTKMSDAEYADYRRKIAARRR